MAEQEVAEARMEPAEESGGLPAVADVQPMNVERMVERLDAVNDFVDRVLVEDRDYGSLPGMDRKFLYKSGAEKLQMLFGCNTTTHPLEDHSEPDHESGYPLWRFVYEARSIHIGTGRVIATKQASCSNRENRYWGGWCCAVHKVPAKPARGGICAKHGTELRKAKYGPDEGQQTCPDCGWRVPDEVIEAEHFCPLCGGEAEEVEIGPKGDAYFAEQQIRMIAQKRAEVAVGIKVGALADRFTQDEEGVAGDEGTEPSEDEEGSARPASGKEKAESQKVVGMRHDILAMLRELVSLEGGDPEDNEQLAEMLKRVTSSESFQGFSSLAAITSIGAANNTLRDVKAAWQEAKGSGDEPPTGEEGEEGTVLPF